MRAPVGLVLAAGAGRRLGLGPKALLRRGAATLVETVVETFLTGGCAQVIVVTGAGADAVTELLDGRTGVALVHNPDWETGMGSSLRCGLLAAARGRDVLVVPVDRSGLSAAEVARVIAAHRPGGITAAAHRDRAGQLRRGHPVLFDSQWVGPAAASAHDDVGARDLLAAVPGVVTLVDCSDLDDGRDIDLPADWAGLREDARDAPDSSGPPQLPGVVRCRRMEGTGTVAERTDLCPPVTRGEDLGENRDRDLGGGECTDVETDR